MADRASLTAGQELRLVEFLGDEPLSATDPAEPEDPVLAPGAVLGGCRLERLVGRGGMGEVYLAEHLALARKVAVKVVGPLVAGDPGALARFEREARLAAQIDSPHVVPVLDAGIEGGVPFIVLAYVEGESLEATLRREGRLTAAEAIEVLRQTARGLSAAHARGIVHRDVKPGNLLRTRDGTIRIADFGLARDVLSSSVHTAEGSLLGTLPYMAPEQARGGPADARSDLYALGATIYRSLTGRAPHDGPHPAAILRSLLEVEVPRVSSLAPDVPARLERIVGRLLAKDPAARFATADELLAALDDPTRSIRSARRRPRPWVVATGLAAIVLPAAVAAWIVQRGGRDGPSGPPSRQAFLVPVGARWPEDGVLWIDSGGEGRREFPPLATGWSRRDDALEANAEASALGFPIPALSFWFDGEIDAAEGTALRWILGRSARNPGGLYEVLWRPGEAIEWRCVRTGSLLAQRGLSSPASGRRRVRLGWFRQRVLTVEIDEGADALVAEDPEPAPLGEDVVSIEPVGGPIRFERLRIFLPPRR